VNTTEMSKFLFLYNFFFRIISTVAYFLNARTVEPEKQPLLANGSETTFDSRQRSQTNRFTRQQSARNSGGIVGNESFYGGRCQL
jgi:hypothetical protein